MSAQINTLICVQLSLICIRLSHGSTKAHATMPIGFMGSNSLALLDWGSRCLATKQENAWIHAFVLLLSLTPKYLRFQSVKYKTISTHNTFRHRRVHFYAFTRQPFSNQLYLNLTFSIGCMRWYVHWLQFYPDAERVIWMSSSRSELVYNQAVENWPFCVRRSGTQT